jgi:Acetyltransferase (GNAT) domain
MKDHVAVARIEQAGLWNAWHTESGVPSHGWRYNAAYCAAGISPCLARVATPGGLMILPYYERQWQGRTDICSTISVNGASLQGDAAAVMSTWETYARDAGWVAGYLQFEPAAQLGAVAGLMRGHSVFDLDLRSADPLAGASAILRRKRRHADRQGAILVEDAASLTQPMFSLYEHTLTRAGARKFYRLPRAALDAWAASPNSLLLGAATGGEIQSVVLFLVSGARAEYHLGASAEDGRHLSTWLLAKAMEKLKERGVNTVHLGGGVTAGDGLHSFKSHFGGVERRLQTIRHIYDPQTYDRFCRSSGAAPGETWFPAYRWQDAEKIDRTNRVET